MDVLRGYRVIHTHSPRVLLGLAHHRIPSSPEHRPGTLVVRRGNLSTLQEEAPRASLPQTRTDHHDPRPRWTLTVNLQALPDQVPRLIPSLR